MSPRVKGLWISLMQSSVQCHCLILKQECIKFRVRLCTQSAARRVAHWAWPGAHGMIFQFSSDSRFQRASGWLPHLQGLVYNHRKIISVNLGKIYIYIFWWLAAQLYSYNNIISLTASSWCLTSRTIIKERSCFFADSRMATATNTTTILEPANTRSHTLKQIRDETDHCYRVKNNIVFMVDLLRADSDKSLAKQRPNHLQKWTISITSGNMNKKVTANCKN